MPCKAFRQLTVLLSLCLALCACTPRDSSPERDCLLRIGTSGDYAPFSIRTPKGSAGLDIAIAEQLGRDLGCRVELVAFRWPALLGQLERGAFDVAASGITMRPERALAGVFSRPYARTGVVIITADEYQLLDLHAVNHRDIRVAVNRGGHLERWARAHLPNARIETVDDNRALPDQLRSGRVAAIVTDTAEAVSWSLAGRQLGPFSTDYKAMLIHPRQRDLPERIDHWLAEREADGTLHRLRSHFLGGGQAGDAGAATVQAVAALARLRLSLMPLVAAAKSTIGKTVTDRVQEKRVIDRARSWSDHPSERIDQVFRVLIALAVKIQRRSADDGPAPSLEELRTAIHNIDRQIVRELDRLPTFTDRHWRSALAPIQESLPLQPGEIDDLADALSRDPSRPSS